MKKHKVKTGRELKTLDPQTRKAQTQTVSSFPTTTPPSSQAKSSRGYRYGEKLSSALRVRVLNDCQTRILGLMVEATTSEEGPSYRQCQRSVAWFMHHSGKAERTVQNALREIEKVGIFTLIRKGQNQDGINTTNVWEFNPDVLDAMASAVTSSWRSVMLESSTPMPSTFDLTEEMFVAAEALGASRIATGWIYDEFVAQAESSERKCMDWEAAFLAYVKATWINGTPMRLAMDGFCAGARRALGHPQIPTFNVLKCITPFLTPGADIEQKVDAWAFDFFNSGFKGATLRSFAKFIKDSGGVVRAAKPASEPLVERQRVQVFHEPPPPRFAPEPCPPQFADLTNVKLPTRRAVPQVQSPPSEPVPTPRLAVTEGHKDAPLSRVNVVAPPPRVSPVKANVVSAPRGLYAKLLANESERMTTRLLDDGADVDSQRSSAPEVGHLGARRGGRSDGLGALYGL